MILLIAQARMQSTRLPGKVLKTIRGKRLLDYHLMRLSKAKMVHKLVVATSKRKADDPIVKACDDLGVTVVRGPASDVLGRYEMVVQQNPAYDTIIRTTCDCPLIDPNLIDNLCQFFLENQPLDYANITAPHYPRGLDAEIFFAKNLHHAAKYAETPYDREHVTPYIRRAFACKSLPAKTENIDLRWCVDEPRDFEAVRAILEALPENKALHFSWRDCLKIVRQNPNIAAINGRVLQKPAQ